MAKRIIYVPNYKIIGEILSQKEIPPGAKVILWYLIGKLGYKNRCWPSQTTIGKGVGLSSRQVRNHLSILEKHEIIKTFRNAFSYEKGQLKTNEYYLTPILRKKEIGTEEEKEEEIII